ncbi:Unknown protein, partial [Striga hermonthica]
RRKGSCNGEDGGAVAPVAGQGRGRLEKRARGHPFSREILTAPLPNNFRVTNLVYDGSSDPSRRVRTFENMDVLHGYSDSEKSPPRGRSPRRSLPRRIGPKRTSPRGEGRDSKQAKRDDRWQGRPLLFERQRYHNFTPLRKDMTEVLEAMEQKMLSKDVTWPKIRFTGSTRPRSDIYCRFHRDYGHTTENCRHLKDEIERLIRAGHLKEFVYHDRVKRKGRRRCREDSEERSDRDEEGDDRDGRDGQGKKPRRDGEKGGQGGEALVKRETIYMISGGPTDGDSNNSRKEHARAVKRKRDEVGITARMPVISFKAEDVEGVVLPHNDALVSTAEVPGFDMKRVFIDTGSSVDVMFYDCFSQINKELNIELKPVATTLYGFNRGEVMPWA